MKTSLEASYRKQLWNGMEIGNVGTTERIKDDTVGECKAALKIPPDSETWTALLIKAGRELISHMLF